MRKRKWKKWKIELRKSENLLKCGCEMKWINFIDPWWTNKITKFKYDREKFREILMENFMEPAFVLEITCFSAKSFGFYIE